MGTNRRPLACNNLQGPGVGQGRRSLMKKPMGNTDCNREIKGNKACAEVGAGH